MDIVVIERSDLSDLLHCLRILADILEAKELTEEETSRIDYANKVLRGIAEGA